jgi:hypothetical protein
MESFSKNSELDEELENIENKIKEIEKTFLEELYNLNVEDLEKVATLNETENIDDSILNIFASTYAKLNTERADLQMIYDLLSPPPLSSVKPLSVASTNELQTSVGEPNVLAPQQNDIEQQIKNAAIEALQKQIELGI